MKAIVVVDNKWGIGKNNDLLFKLPKDLAMYKSKTMGNVCVMGANTYESLPKVALKGRINVVLDHLAQVHENAQTVDTLQSLLDTLKKFDTEKVFVIGGASIYKLLIDFCDEAYVTKVDADGDATVFFPNLDQKENWVLDELGEPIEDNGYSIRFCTYKKK